MRLIVNSTAGPAESSFLAEVRAQWREAIRIRLAAEADGDSWLTELMTGRLEDLKEQVERTGLLAPLEWRRAEAAAVCQ